MKINNKFIRYDKLGKALHHLIALDWTIEVERDIFGNGTMYFHHPNRLSTFIEFTEMNVNDEVEITYNELGKVTVLR